MKSGRKRVPKSLVAVNTYVSKEEKETLTLASGMPLELLLMTTHPGEEATVRQALGNVDLVTDHWMLFGEYDLIARVQADEEYALTRCIVEEIRQLPGVKDTKTLIGAEL